MDTELRTYSFGNRPPPAPMQMYPLPDSPTSSLHPIPTAHRSVFDKYKSLLVLMATCICAFFNQYQPVSPLIILFQTGILVFIHWTPNWWFRWLGTILVSLVLSLSMAQVFRDDDTSNWEWKSFGYIVGIDLGVGHAFFILAVIHNRLSIWSDSKGFLFTYATLLTTLYSIMGNFTPLGTLTNIGYAFYDWQSFVQVVSLFGLSSLTWILLTLATCIAHALVIDNQGTRESRRQFSKIFGVFLFLITWLYGSIRLLAPYMYQLAVEDTAIPNEDWLNAACVVIVGQEADAMEMTETLLAANPTVEFVMWTEAAKQVPYYDDRNMSNIYSWQEPRLSEFIKSVSNLSAAYNTTIAATYAVWASPYDVYDDSQYNDLIMIDPIAGDVGEYSKIHPVPIIEIGVIPGPGKYMLSGSTSNIGQFTAGICFDYDFPLFVRNSLSQEGAGGLLIQPANTWGFIGRWHGVSSSFRAIETGRYLARCGAQGPSGLWDPYGSTLAYQSRSDVGVVQFQIPVNPEKVWTVYQSFGFVFDFIVYAFAAIYFGFFFFSLCRPKTRQPETERRSSEQIDESSPINIRNSHQV
jgi:apolipoprotein N-acyltransferase